MGQKKTRDEDQAGQNEAQMDWEKDLRNQKGRKKLVPDLDRNVDQKAQLQAQAVGPLAQGQGHGDLHLDRKGQKMGQTCWDEDLDPERVKAPAQSLATTPKGQGPGD